LPIFLDFTNTIASIAINGYHPVDVEDLPFSKGDTIYVLERDDSGWWKGYCGEKVGLFPANYVAIDGVPGPAPAETISIKSESTNEYNYDVLTKWSQLDVTSIPSDIDLNYLENYLPEQEFEKKFSMTIKQFGELPLWKRNQLKRAKNLFGDTLRHTRASHII